MSARDIIAWADHRAESIVRGRLDNLTLMREVRRACCIAYKLGVEDVTAAAMTMRDQAQEANAQAHKEPGP